MNTNDQLPSQLRLAAEIVEKSLPWEWRWSDGPDCTWFPPDERRPDPVTTLATPDVYVNIFRVIRIKPLPVEPKLVPLSKDDVPLLSIIRSKDKKDEYVVLERSESQFRFINSFGTWDACGYRHAFEYGWQIKRPGQEWAACSKPA